MRLPFIIAEIAQGYEGSEKLVNLYVRAAASAGADAVKFQVFYADELALPDYKYYGLFKQLELPARVWKKAARDAHEAGMEFYSDVFGTRSLRLLSGCGADGFKIHTTDINNQSLLSHVGRLRKKVFLSTGGCTLEEIKAALSFLEGCRVTLLYGFQAEPTMIGDNNINRLKTLSSEFGLPVGFQDHTEGGSEMAFLAPFVAMGAGAGVIEKHLTLSRGAGIEDCVSALTVEEFARWSGRLREAYPMLGSGEWVLTGKELEYRRKVRRAVCAAREIRKGTVINKADTVMKRTAKTDCFFDIDRVTGKTTVRAIPPGSVITSKDIR